MTTPTWTVMYLHDMPYVIVREPNKPPVAIPEAQFDKNADAPISPDVEECDCIETAVDFYRLTRERLYSGGVSVLTDTDVNTLHHIINIYGKDPNLSERDNRIITALFDIYNGIPRKPRHT